MRGIVTINESATPRKGEAGFCQALQGHLNEEKAEGKVRQRTARPPGSMVHDGGRDERCFKKARFGGTYTKIGTIRRRFAWPLRKDDKQICEKCFKKEQRRRGQRDGQEGMLWP